MEHSTLFVTGMQRCGTTLLEKLLASHPQLSVLSQPSPLLFIEAKRSFLRQIGRDDNFYPLGDLFLETGYVESDFTRFLSEYSFDNQTLRFLFETMSNYSGQYTRFDKARLTSLFDRLGSANLITVLTALYREFSHNPRATTFGGKESICEEFLPYLLENGCLCVVILRDPRDMLTSLNYGQGQQHGGRFKPTLFNLRNWRKSVAYALHLQDHPRFAWIHYEDLVLNPIESLNQVAPMLNVTRFERSLFAEGIRDQSGKIWTGNSSHFTQHGISNHSIGSYKSLLPPTVTAYAEAVCYPELNALGYPVSVHWNEVPGIITAFEEPYQIEREHLHNNFESPKRTEEELRRYDFLSNRGDAQASYFLFEELIPVLREAVRK